MPFVVWGILGVLGLGAAAKLFSSAAEDTGEAVNSASNGALKLVLASGGAVGAYLLWKRWK